MSTEGPLGVSGPQAMPGIDKMRDGLQEYLAAVGEDGDTEMAVNAVLIYESQGIEPSGEQFWKHSYIAVVNSGQRSAVRGLVEIVVPEIIHDLTCQGECCS